MSADKVNVYVGVCLIRLELPRLASLKEKRSLVLPITEKLKARYPVSVARLAGQNSHTWELIGITAISGDRVWLERLLNKVNDFVAAQGVGRVAASSVEIDVWDEADTSL